MITLDITLLIHIINIFVLMYILNKIFYAPVREILEKREAKKEALGKDVVAYEKTARHRQEEVDKQRRQASARAKEALEKARSEAQAAGDEKLAVIRAEANSEKEKQLDEIRAQMELARKTLQENTAEFARDMAGKILGRSLEA